MVPIGDELLFAQYDACLNLGGIANISYRWPVAGSPDAGTQQEAVNSKQECRRVAFDICPCNMALNRLAACLGLDYDRGGALAAQGHVYTCLLAVLGALPYYAAPAPKSLGKEWFDAEFWPLIDSEFNLKDATSVKDVLATVSSHIAIQISTVLRREKIGTLLVTGGGAFNDHLIDTMRQLCPDCTIVVPDALTVNYKEAIVFALLGYLRLKGKMNTLSSVTGARNSSCGGSISGMPYVATTASI